MVAGVAQIATCPPPAAAGLIAGTVPMIGSSGSKRARSTGRACTEAVLQATIRTSGPWAAAASHTARARWVMSSGVRGPQGIPSGSQESTSSASGRSRRTAAAAGSRPIPESMSAIFTRPR